MRAGVQVSLKDAQEILAKTDFSQVEILYDRCDFDEYASDELLRGRITGVCIKMEELCKHTITSCISFLERQQGSYLVIATMNGEESVHTLGQLLCDCRREIEKSGICVLIENGCRKLSEDYHCSTTLSDAAGLRRLIEDVQVDMPTIHIGICFNTGIANLTGQNMRAMLADLGDLVKLVHVNDNDGKRDMRQIPYSFTTGRGRKSTDWTRFVGQLIRQSYEGDMIFDTTGLFACAPRPLQKVFCQLLYRIYQEWEKQYHFEEVLKKEPNGWILFGAGQMSRHFLERWGEKYPPFCLTDNNEALWNKQKDGVSIIAPSRLAEAPYCNHRVLICNQYYAQIRRQLEEMGITYDCYYDEYDF